jgi:hypothetical protein
MIEAAKVILFFKTTTFFQKNIFHEDIFLVPCKVPNVSKVPKVPIVPIVPNVPQIPYLPQIPQIPSPQKSPSQNNIPPLFPFQYR